MRARNEYFYNLILDKGRSKLLKFNIIIILAALNGSSLLVCPSPDFCEKVIFRISDGN